MRQYILTTEIVIYHRSKESTFLLFRSRSFNYPQLTADQTGHYFCIYVILKAFCHLLRGPPAWYEARKKGSVGGSLKRPPGTVNRPVLSRGGLAWGSRLSAIRVRLPSLSSVCAFPDTKEEKQFCNL